MRNKQNVYLLGRVICIAALVLLCLELAGSFYGRHFNNVAQSISIFSFYRLAAGMPYIAVPGELPVHFSSFSPLYFWLFKPFLLFSADWSLSSFVALLTVLQSVVLALVLMLLFKLGRLWEPELNRLSFLLVVVWLYLFSGLNWLSLRPDVLAIGCELAGLWCFSKYYFEKQGKGYFIAAVVALGTAAAVKISIIGVCLGLALFLASRARLGLAFLLGAISLLVFGVWSCIVYLIVGSETLEVPWLLTFQTDFAVKIRYFYVELQSFGYGLLSFSLFGLLNALGLLLLFRRSRDAGFFWLLLILAELLVAMLTSLKPGAALNYYWAFFLVSAIPVMLGVQWLFGRVESVAGEGLLAQALLLILAAELAIRGALVFADWPMRGLMNYRPDYDFPALIEYLDREHPNDVVYAAHDDVVLHLRERVVLGPWMSAYFNLSPALGPEYQKVFQSLRETLPEGRFDLVVAYGSDCADWREHGVFSGFTDGVDQLLWQKGKLCVLGRGE